VVCCCGGRRGDSTDDHGGDDGGRLAHGLNVGRDARPSPGQALVR
jgi:hypothetical protein